jgi:hypothetical protein
LISGQGLLSFAFLFAAIWWAALGVYWGRRSPKRHGIGELAGARRQRQRVRQRGEAEARERGRS